MESAFAFPLLVVLALALVQFALYAHAVDVAEGACQDGARVAAQADRSVGDGVATARALLQAGLGPSAGQVAVTGQSDGQVVVVRAQGQVPLLLPWIGDAALPIRATAQAEKEEFRADGGETRAGPGAGRVGAGRPAPPPADQRRPRRRPHRSR